MAAVNPVYLCYSSTQRVVELAAPGAIFIPDQHRDDPVYAQAQAKGAEVYPYLDMVEDHVRGDKDREFRAYAWAHRGGVPERWGNARASWYPLLNTRVGSEYVKRTVDYIAREFMPRFDGITLDVVGGQLHTKADWKNWPAAERKEWQDGMVDFVRLLDERRRAVKPWFKIDTINIWDQDKRGLQYVDGFCVELTGLDPSTPGVGPFRQQLVQAQCSYLGQRRVLVIARNTSEALQFAALPGVTHVTATPIKPYYQVASPPVVPAVDNRLTEAQAMREWLHQQRATQDSGAERIAELTQQLAATRAELAATYDQLTGAVSSNKVLSGRIDALTTKLNTLSEQLTSLAEVARE